VTLWTFYQQAVAMARRSDSAFPRFDHACFVEALVEVGDMLWEGMRPYIKGSRYEEYRATLTPRERLWQWLLSTIRWGSYGSCVRPWPAGLEYSHYDPATPGVPAPVPAAQEILGGSAEAIEFSDDEKIRVNRCAWLECQHIEKDAQRETNETDQSRQ